MRLFVKRLGETGRRKPSLRIDGFLARVRQFGRASDGTGIVEFALILPAMLLIYCGLGELAHALETSRKVGSYTRTIADLVGRTQVDASELNSLFDAAAVILQPYDASKAKIVVSAMGVVRIGTTYYPLVCSSAARNATARSPSNKKSVEADVSAKKQDPAPAVYQYEKAYFILAEVEVPFKPVLGSIFFNWINQNTVYFKEKISWPERPETQIILPGGQPCPTMLGL